MPMPYQNPALPRKGEVVSSSGWLLQFENRISRAVEWLCAKDWRSALALILLCLALYLPGIAALPVTDRDEARFAQASKQMLESGDFIDIRFQDEPRYKKPIGIYWLQSLSVAALGGGARGEIWAYRLPSLLGAIAAVLLTWRAARPLFGRKTALLAAALLASTVTLAMEARLAKSDAALLACIVLAQGALARLYLLPAHRQTAGLAALFWIGLGLGILIKGPVAPAVLGLTAAALIIFDRGRAWLKHLRIAWGAPLLLAIILPWFIAIGLSSEGEFFHLSFGADFLGKVRGGQEKHGAPPGYFLLLFWWTFWPAALLASGGAALWLWRNRARRRALFLLAAIAPFWLVIEAMPTKLPHYILPVFPPAALAIVWIWREQALTGSLASRAYKQAAALWLVIAGLQLGLLGLALWLFEADVDPLAIALALGVMVCGVLAGKAAWRMQLHAGAALVIMSAILLYALAFQFVLPRLQPLWLSQHAAEAIAAFAPCHEGPAAFARYHEPSAVFLNGADTILTSPEGAAEALLAGRAAYALVPENRMAGFAALFHARGAPAPSPLACVEGYNLNKGDAVKLRLYAAKPLDAFAACQAPQHLRCESRPERRWLRLLGR